MSRYLVTGCAGFIGSHLTDALLTRGDDVLGVDAFTSYYARDTKQSNLGGSLTRGLSLIELDLSRDDLTPLVESVDGVFHLAAQPGVRGSWGDTFVSYVRDNILASQRLFEATAPKQLRVVMASSSSVYGNAPTYPTREDAPLRPMSPYGATKEACESLAHTYVECFGLQIVLLRYFTVYGPRQRPDMAFARIISALLAGDPFVVHGTGEQSRDFTYVEDAIAATLAAMDGGPTATVYNVGGGSETSLNDAIEICECLADKKLKVINEGAARGDVVRTGADTSLIRSELGWTPRTSLPDGLAAQLAAARGEAGATA
jgi:UDP-glucuronate 4-epimerase